MKNVTSESLCEYISFKRNSLQFIMALGLAADTLDGIGLIKINTILDELKEIEEWFGD